MMATCSGWTPVAFADVREEYPCASLRSVASCTANTTTYPKENAVPSVKVRQFQLFVVGKFI